MGKSQALPLAFIPHQCKRLMNFQNSSAYLVSKLFPWNKVFQFQLIMPDILIRSWWRIASIFIVRNHEDYSALHHLHLEDLNLQEESSASVQESADLLYLVLYIHFAFITFSLLLFYNYLLSIHNINTFLQQLYTACIAYTLAVEVINILLHWC